MSTVDLPTPIVVTRHQCPFCRRHTRADPARVQDHMTRCWKNPALRNCKTCEHHLPASQGESCDPSRRCHCNDYAEACDVSAAPPGATFPISHCPSWEARK
ncbi:hypothetical protein ACIGMX_34800 [Streptomyces aquilus]|uniref:hypothetical protein n=1 Tax=Streptomyces aquilus TaxID=2548456 RepID=UPI0037D94765